MTDMRRLLERISISCLLFVHWELKQGVVVMICLLDFLSLPTRLVLLSSHVSNR